LPPRQMGIVPRGGNPSQGLPLHMIQAPDESSWSVRHHEMGTSDGSWQQKRWEVKNGVPLQSAPLKQAASGVGVGGTAAVGVAVGRPVHGSLVQAAQCPVVGSI